jgi:AhpD family alkylhydroperoxidase
VDYQAFGALAPKAYAALLALGRANEETGFDRRLSELIKVRVSQINACAFCLQHHLNIARSIGVEPQKLDLLATWRDAGVFSDREAAALAWAECLTNIAAAGAPDHAYDAVRTHFSEAETVSLTLAIGTINAWNRLGVGLRFAPMPARVAAS